MRKKQSAGGKIQWSKMLKKLSPYTIQKGFRYLKHDGPKEFWIRLHERFEPEEVPYGHWDEISEAISSLECADALLTCKNQTEKLSPFVSEETDKERYTQAFERFITPLQKKHFQKLVLSRSSTKHINDDFSPLAAFVRACNNYPRMMIYLCHTPVSGTWVGSTPEILLRGHGKEWHTVALAGTMPMQNEVMPMDWDKKNQDEQGYVADYIRRIIKKFGNKMNEKGPYTARAGQLVHLKTDFYFLLKNTDNIGNLLQELHPTPAVCGLPKEDAFRFILENEGYDRSYYSGFIGWLDTEGHTDLYVNLRCMEIKPGETTLYAGGGILASSEIESEWTETGDKMNTMKSILYPEFINR